MNDSEREQYKVAWLALAAASRGVLAEGNSLIRVLTLRVWVARFCILLQVAVSAWDASIIATDPAAWWLVFVMPLVVWAAWQSLKAERMFQGDIDMVRNRQREILEQIKTAERLMK